MLKPQMSNTQTINIPENNIKCQSDHFTKHRRLLGIIPGFGLKLAKNHEREASKSFQNNPTSNTRKALIHARKRLICAQAISSGPHLKVVS